MNSPISSSKVFCLQRSRFLMRFALFAMLMASTVRADDANSAKSNAASKSEGLGTKRALIICGLSGDAEHHKLFCETLVKLQRGLTNTLGCNPDNVTILFGDAAKESDPELLTSAERTTREQLEKSVTKLRAALQPNDSLWVIVMGHTHFDDTNSWLNLSGPDIHQTDFGKLFHGVECRQQVFIVTTPTSGFYIKPLSAKGRVIFAATEDSAESNETEFPHEFARVLEMPPEAKEFDIDQDGSITLLDLYLTVARNLAQSYLERELVATEHALLDDNGDGRGTEIQIDFLTDEQGGRAKPNRPFKLTLPPTADGVLSKAIMLRD